MATLMVKRVRASAAQTQNIVLLVKIGKSMGANRSQLAGAQATMTQESTCINLPGGDRDSAGLFQQRPSCGWGTYAQVTNPDYAIRKFMTPYLNYCRQGLAPIAASHKVQASGSPMAPAQWYHEAWNNVGAVSGGKDFTDITFGSAGLGGTDVSVVRNLPYEFSRGTPDKPENSWDCLGRLADEVKWRRFVRAGALWFVSEDWLARQPIRYTFAEGVRGVLTIAFSADSRRNAAECTVTALAKRWSVLPGDVVRLRGQGPADGNWLVKSTRRSLADATTEIALVRPAPKLPEPAPQTSTTSVNIGGGSVPTLSGYNLKDANTPAAKVYAAAKAISDHHYPYVYGGGHGTCGKPSTGRDPGIGFDCSSSVCAALGAAGLGYHLGGGVDVSGTMAANYGQPGGGKYFTVWANVGHVWMQFHGLGAWRFDTSPYGPGPSGPQLRATPRPTSGFTPRHWPGA
jgi:hypothetical protein